MLVDIFYPTDLHSNNEACEKTEAIIDQLHQERPNGIKKLRTYHKRARKEYLDAVKEKSKS